MSKPSPVQDLTVLATGLKYPEGPVYMRDGSVLVAEMAAGRVSRVAPDGTVSVVANVGGGPNGLAIGPDKALYVCNNGGLLFQEVDGLLGAVHGRLPADYESGSIQRVDLENGEVRTLYTHCRDQPLCGPNDLVFDRDGGMYFTDFGKTRGRMRDIGSVYYAKADGSSIVELIHPIAAPNGIGLSPDQRTLYVTETDTARLWAYPLMGAGALQLQRDASPNGGRFVAGAPGYQRFDSLAVQQDGTVCIGTLVTGRITQVSPSGEINGFFELPDAHTTNLCFGGSDLKTAYVTLTMTGQLVAIDWTQPGLRLNYNA